MIVPRETRRIVSITVMVGFVLSIIALIPASAGASAGWKVQCDWSHSLEDDPIVFPRQPGASHMHDFLGAKDVNAFSTVKSMRQGGTTCGLAADTAGYWVPTLYTSAGPVHPIEDDPSYDGDTDQQIYYRNDLDSSEDIVVPPKNLRMVTGNARATNPSENPLLGTSKMYFNCNDGEGDEDKVAIPPTCDDGILVLHVRFPQCWDGVHLDSPDHISHMAWVGDGDTCPSSHPVAIPRVTTRTEYPVGDESIMFSSGPFYTVHGDFWQTWRMRKLRDLVANCLVADKDCGTFGDGD